MTASVHDIRGRGASPMLPLSIEAEQGVLGAILINNGVHAHVTDFLKPEHFSEEIHKRVYDVASQLIRAGKPATPITLKTYLGDADLGGLTIPQYLARLAAEAVGTLIAPSMAREIRDLAARRDLIGVGEHLVEQAQDARPDASLTELAAASLAELQRIADLTIPADTRRDAGESAAALVDRARAIMAGEKRDSGISTGLKELDRVTNGFQPGTLWIVAGRPRMGKSILGTGFARRIAARGTSDVADAAEGVGAQYFSLELPEDQIVARILSDLAYSPRRPVSFGNIMKGALDESDLWAVEEAQQKLAGLPLALDVASALSVQEIAARIRSEKMKMAKKGIRLAVAFVDYLKYVRVTDRYRGNRVYEVGEISGSLKQLAKAENLCIVLLAQVNRSVDGRDRKDHKPRLADLRESGDLEADADVVLFIDRESVRIKQSAEYERGDADTVNRFIELEHKADLIVAKTRVGSETSIPVWIDAGCSTFAAQDFGGAR